MILFNNLKINYKFYSLGLQFKINVKFVHI